MHADRYVSVLGGRIEFGPAFAFPPDGERPSDVVVVEDERLLERNFRGWVPGEIAAGRSPVLAVVEDGGPVSVCFCARRSDVAAEAGLETAEAFRVGLRSAGDCGVGALDSSQPAGAAVQHLVDNHASLAVARKLGLLAYASHSGLLD